MRARFLVAVAGLLVALAPAGAAAQVPTLPPLQPPPSQEPPPDEKPPPPPAAVGGDEAEWNLDGNPAHTRTTGDTTVFGPLEQVWTADVTGTPKQMIVAGGRVHTLGDGLATALDAGTGRRIWQARWSPTLPMVYAAGRLIATDTSTGDLVALDAVTGQPAWRTEFGENRSVGALTAGNGLVVISLSDGSGPKVEIAGVRASDGRQQWARDLTGPDDFSAAIAGDRAFFATRCGGAEALALADGRSLWQRGTTDCQTGGTAVADGVVYPLGRYGNDEPREASLADSGASAGQYPAGRDPAIAGGVEYTAADDGLVTAREALGGRVLWTARDPRRSGGSGTNPGIAVAGGTVLVHREYAILVLDRGTGAIRTVVELPSVAHSGSSETTPDAVAVAGGLVFTSVRENVYAHRSLLRPAPRGVDLAADGFAVLAGRSVEFAGAVGSELRGTGGAPVEWQADRFPYGRWVANGRTTAGTDSVFTGRTAVTRNTRYRAVAGGAASNVLEVRAFPRYAFGRPRATRRRGFARVRVRVSGARDLGAAGRTMVVYLGRRGARRYERLGMARAARSGRDGAAARVVYRIPRRVGRKDVIAVCVRGLARRGFGVQDEFNRRCGARRIPLRR